jgi:ABC-type transport system involved in multi-copper enzyme maturation permease subunit
MIRAMLWKEFREQGLIALTLLVLGTGILVAAAVLGDPPSAASGPTDIVRALGAGRLATLMLAVTAGMVCGGALFAAERESGTIGFLESLPASRWEVWRAKLVAGTVLAVAQVGVVLAVAWVLGAAPADFAARVAVYAALAFVWGAYGSTVSRTTLGSVGVAIPCAILATFVFLIPIVLLFPAPGTNLPRSEGEFLFLALMVGVPLAMSALAFTRQDRDRASEEVRPAAWAAGRGGAIPLVAKPAPAPPPRRGGARFGLKALLWLAAKQVAWTAVVLSAFAVMFGLMMLTPGLKPFLMWPSLALAAGVLAGATVFSDEQSSGSARFWGDWRLPAGRMWAVKVAVHLALALWLVFLLILPLVIRAQLAPGGPITRGQSFLSSVFGTLLFDELERQSWKVVFLPALYGFAAGHLCGMLFKKVVVAVGVAALLGGTTAALWVPSLLGGGVLHWQVWLPPLAALAVARGLVRPWASNRLATRGPIVTLAAGCAGVLLLQAGGLAYRVLEVPSKADADADQAFVAELPLLDENKVGRDMRSAGERYARLATASAARFDARPHTGGRQLRIDEQLDTVGVSGWPNDDANLGAFLTELYKD